MRSFQFQETLHKHDIVEVEKADDTKDEHSSSLSIPGNMLRSGSRKYSVYEGIDSPALVSPFGSGVHDSMYEDELMHSDGRRSPNFDKFQSQISSLRSRQDNEEECMGASDGYKDLPATDTANGIQG